MRLHYKIHLSTKKGGIKMKKIIVGLLLLTVFTGLFANVTGGPARKQPMPILVINQNK